MCLVCGNIAETQTAVTLFSTYVLAFSPLLALVLQRASRFVEIGYIKKATKSSEFFLIALLTLVATALIAQLLSQVVLNRDVYITVVLVLHATALFVVLNSLMHTRRKWHEVLEWWILLIAMTVLMVLLLLAVYQLYPSVGVERLFHILVLSALVDVGVLAFALLLQWAMKKQ